MEQTHTSLSKAQKAPVHRVIENAHIFLWLLKDTCWITLWKPGGVFMIFPTLSMAFYILWKSRHHRAEVFHNLAICLWISANSVWMLSEFFNVEKQYKKFAVYIFLTGIALLLVYYFFFFRKDKMKERDINATI
jgi:hypothetical protein